MENYVLVLNWNGWKNTIECLESVLRLNGNQYRVVVCDNSSEDGSLDRMRQWAAGTLLADPSNPQLAHLTSPPLPKPIPYREFSREEVDRGVAVGEEQLVLIRVGANLGYAGGNNVALRYALQDPAARYFWILNNDTVVEQHALSSMVEFMSQHPDVGMCGSLNMAYYNPAEIQVYGGRRYNRWTGRVLPVSLSAPTGGDGACNLDYVHGASVLVTREFVEKVGFMDESYFIYFEELDWAERGRGKFALGYAPNSVIYHKEGATTGSSEKRQGRSLTAEKYQAKNRILFARKNCPWTLPTVVVSVCATAIHRLCVGDAERAKTILSWGLKGLFAGLGNADNRFVASPNPSSVCK